jgi:septum formation protein
MTVDFVHLASRSPRRRELLRQAGIPFRVVDVAVDESVRAGEPAAVYVARLAEAKAATGWCTVHGAGGQPVLAADTAVVLGEKILGKPAGRDDALAMLQSLSGRTHVVLTAVAVCGAGGGACRISRSEVTFRDISAAECSAYWETAEPCDKAGAYAIQGFAAVFIAALNGSYSGVMGLPLFETAELLQAAGVPRWLRA